MQCLQEDELLLRRIDALLRQDPPPPDEVLQRIVEVLQRARGHTPHSTNWSHVAERVRERPRPQGAMAQAREERERITRRPHSTRGHSALSLPIGESDTARCALPNSTLFYQVPGQVNRTDAATSVLRPPIEGERQRKTRELQDLMAGVGGKYCHADFHPDGGTQIGGMRTKSKSMVGADYGTKGELTGIATALAKGKPPYIQNGKNDFRF